MNTIRTLVLLVFLSVLLPCCREYATCPDPVDSTYEAPNGAATLVVQNGVRILKLRGSGYERGYAYGYLLAPEIVFVMDNVILPGVEVHQNYDGVRSAMALVDWGNAYGDELEGMLAGIRARLPVNKQMIHPPWKSRRQLDLVDLQLANSISDWLCSSFSVWGAGRADTTTLYARNLDYFSGRDDAFQRAQVIVSFDDGDNTRWVTASVCGLVGGITSMSEYGMTLALHDTDFYPTSDTAGFIPRCLMVRRIMEQSAPDWTPVDIGAALDLTPDYFGTNLHAAFPSAGRGDDAVAGVLEFDGYTGHADGRATLRSPSENPVLPAYQGYDHSFGYTFALINTNHYVKRKPATGAAGNSGDRYLKIKEQLETAGQDGDVTVEEARSVMAAVGGTGTMHTAILEPDSRIMRLYFAEPGKAAFDCPQHVYAFEELF